MVLLSAVVQVNAQRFVKPNGNDNADGKSWDTAWKTLKYAVNHVYSNEPIYFAKGTYYLSSGAVTSEAINSTVQQRTNYIIRGGYPDNLKGTDTRPYDPVNNVTRFAGTAIFNLRENTGDFDLEGVHFIDVAGGGGAVSSPVFTAENTEGKTYTFTDIYVKHTTGTEGGEQAVFKFDQVRKAKITFKNVVFEDNEMITIGMNRISANNDVIIEKSYFKNTRTLLEGGCIRFFGNAIQSNFNRYYIRDNTFCNNRAAGGLVGGGGAILADNYGELELTNNKFIGNSSALGSAPHKGGAVF